jgi:hypothetical protein
MTLAELVNSLELAGFYDYALPEHVEGIKNRTLQTGFIYSFSDGTNRCYNADAESLAECGVELFLERVDSFLRQQGVFIQSVETNCHFPKEYEIKVNGIAYQMFSAQEAETLNLWSLVTKRAFRLVNDLLEQASSPERLFQLYADNDTGGLFLTEKLYDILSASDVLPNENKPILISKSRV